jgi:hypothetical protein
MLIKCRAGRLHPSDRFHCVESHHRAACFGCTSGFWRAIRLSPLAPREVAARVGWTIPFPITRKATHVRSNACCGPDAPRSITRWPNRNCSNCLTSLAPLRRRAARGSRAHRTRPWPRRHSLQGWSAVFLKPQFRAQHERPGFPTANDHNRTTSGPRLLMSQWSSSKGAQCRSCSYPIQHNTRAHGHKALPEQNGD